MLDLWNDELFYFMKDKKYSYDYWIRIGSELLSIVHEGNDPWVGLRHNKIVNIEKHWEFIHR